MDLDFTKVYELIRPELLLLIPFCLIVGKYIKSWQKVNDKWIPSILWAVGITFSFLYLQFMITLDEPFTIIQILILSIVQGTFVSSLAVWGNQQFKQLFKKK